MPLTIDYPQGIFYSPEVPATCPPDPSERTALRQSCALRPAPERIAFLRAWIAYHDHALIRELRALEAKHPELVTPDSPTQRVGGTASKGEKAAHSLRRKTCRPCSTRQPEKRKLPLDNLRIRRYTETKTTNS